MADDGENRDGASTAVRVINHCSAHHRRAEDSSGKDLDSISSLPDVILQEILSFIPTKSAIRTSVLSKRWRHVWSETPSLYFDNYIIKDDCINKTLAHHRARKIKTFQLCSGMVNNLPWIEFVMSRNVENLLLHCFFIQTLPAVSWASLKKLSLRSCSFSDESIDNILSGCPILESLTLYLCHELKVLDLSKSPRLRILDIFCNDWVSGTTHIVAPHIRCLRFTNSQKPCTFVDVSSLTEAKLDLWFPSIQDLKADLLQDMVLKMLHKLENVEKLTFGADFLKILSLAEVRGVPFPMFKAKALTLETKNNQYVIPGIDKYLGKYLDLHGLNMDRWRAWAFRKIFYWNVKSMHMALFMELMLKTTKTLEKMVVRLGSYLDEKGFEKLLEMVQVLSRNNNVSIVLSAAKRSQSV